MRKLDRAVATVMVAVCGLSGCETMSNGEFACLVSAIGGAAIGAAVHEDEEKGALIGATVGALGCGLYRYLNDKQIAEMVEKENAHLASTPPEQPIDFEFALTPIDGDGDAPVVRLQAGEAVAPSTLLGDGASGYTHCRRTRSEVRSGVQEDDEPSVFEQTKCLNAAGDWEVKTPTT